MEGFTVKISRGKRGRWAVDNPDELPDGIGILRITMCEERKPVLHHLQIVKGKKKKFVVRQIKEG